MLLKIEKYEKGKITKGKIIESFQGWSAYSKWGNSYNLKERLKVKLI